MLVAVASDGAGSAARSLEGAELACMLFVREVEALLETGQSVDRLDRPLVERWLEFFQSELRARAQAEGLTTRDYACTFLAAVVAEGCAAFVQVGDGAIVLSDAEAPDDYTWEFWPQRGEYENVTFFATEASAAAHLEFSQAHRRIEEVALFTDGIQRLALQIQDRVAHVPFFRPMFRKVRDAEPGPSEVLSAALADYLGSPAICQRTDDDKTLILATRRAGDALDEEVSGSSAARLSPADRNPVTAPVTDAAAGTAPTAAPAPGGEDGSP